MAYAKIKQMLISPQVLIPYDPALPLLLATDASKTGLGAVLSHRLPNGQERPIAYASRTMNTTEQRYSQIDKEALAIVWAVQKFFKYLYARHWTLITDHKPLVQILQPGKSLPALCISRMANYADFLSNFDFDVVHKTSKENINADYLSRTTTTTKMNKIGCVQATANDVDGFDNFIIRQINQLPLTAESIAQETRKDPHLGKILQLLESGRCLAKAGYKSPEINYKLSAGCITFEHRIVIPRRFQGDVIKELHAAHLGVVKMKGIARSFIYWPGIDKDIENAAKGCDSCAKYANVPAKCKDHHWEYPKGPWERVHIDYAGPVEGMMLLIISDAFSKWLEVKITKSITAATTITLLDEVFATYGVPLMIVSDNGTNFSSAEFNNYLQRVGVKYHKYSAPYHPATNGQAERNVQTVKNALKAMCTTRATLRENLNEFLRHYRNAPHSTTGQSPAQLFLGRQLRTRLDLLRPEETKTKVTYRNYMKNSCNYRELTNNQTVFFLSGNPRISKWFKGKVTKRLGDVHYEILFQGKYYKRHIDQIRGVDQHNEDMHTYRTPITGTGNFTNQPNANIDQPANTNGTENFTNQSNANIDQPSNTNAAQQEAAIEQRDDDMKINEWEKEQEQREYFSTPPESIQIGDDIPTSSTSTPFKGFTESSPKLTTRNAEQLDHGVRRSARTRRPRVLFSP